MLISGQAAFLAILIRSEREEVAACAQHEPQYCNHKASSLSLMMLTKKE